MDTLHIDPFSDIVTYASPVLMHLPPMRELYAQYYNKDHGTRKITDPIGVLRSGVGITLVTIPPHSQATFVDRVRQALAILGYHSDLVPQTAPNNSPTALLLPIGSEILVHAYITTDDPMEATVAIAIGASAVASMTGTIKIATQRYLQAQQIRQDVLDSTGFDLETHFDGIDEVQP